MAHKPLHITCDPCKKKWHGHCEYPAICRCTHETQCQVVFLDNSSFPMTYNICGEIHTDEDVFNHGNWQV